MRLRLNSLLEKLEASSIDGFLVSHEANVWYLCNYKINDSYLLVAKKEVYFITDFRYREEAKRNIKAVKVFQYKNLSKDIANLAKRLGIRRLGFEAKSLNFAEYCKIKDELDQKIKLVDTFNIIESLREIKDAQELKVIKEAVGITAKAFGFIDGFLRKGLSEVEIAGELERFIRYNGAKMSAFNIIVASGPNASFPHAAVSDRKIRGAEPILVDMGVEVNGYKSDLTRVFFLDKIPLIQRRIYNIIKEAQLKAIEIVKPGIEIREVDNSARSYIAKSGYGKYFGHSLGHGVGLEVHEEPSISGKNSSKLREGMVFTIEPGIYLPGRFGIRLEDMVLATKKGAEVLSGAINKSI